MNDGPRRIDTHQHVVPPMYAEWLADQGQKAGGLPIPAWNAEAALAVMDGHGVETAILSVSTPGAHLGDDLDARRMARTVNEYTADIVRKYPGRFGFFATLTLPDVEGSIAEAAYALDVLGADGVVLLANINGAYLGDAPFDSLFDELDRRDAVVFVHPSQLEGIAPVEGIPPFVADFLLDTTRAAMRLGGSGTLERCPNLNLILSHAGGFVPYAASRIATSASPTGNPAEGMANLRRFYFDTALSSSPYALPSLLAFAAPGHVTFGSDWPYAADRAVGGFVRMFERYELDEATRSAIDRDNAEVLFPRLAT